MAGMERPVSSPHRATMRRRSSCEVSANSRAVLGACGVLHYKVVPSVGWEIYSILDLLRYAAPGRSLGPRLSGWVLCVMLSGILTLVTKRNHVTCRT